MKQRFFCIDAHTCGNPVRVIVNGLPNLKGKTIAEKRLDFIEHHDWIRKSLMFEPRGHDMMSGSFLLPPVDPTNDIAILFVETSGCLPMCGHGTIGTITVAIEEGLVHPKTQGVVRIETPAGLVIAHYELGEANKVTKVKITNVPSFLFSEGWFVKHSVLGEVYFDIAYGGNFYAIIEPQANFSGIEGFTADELIIMSRELRILINDKYAISHPLDSNIRRCSHILWTGNVLSTTSTARNAVFYGDKAIDRSPCGTGTSARMAQWFSKGRLEVGDSFIHESYIGSIFEGRVEEVVEVGEYRGIVPSVAGWAKIYGYNTIMVDTDDDPFALGFQVI